MNNLVGIVRMPPPIYVCVNSSEINIMCSNGDNRYMESISICEIDISVLDDEM